MTQVHVNDKGAVRIFKPKLNDSSFNFIFVNGERAFFSNFCQFLYNENA